MSRVFTRTGRRSRAPRQAAPHLAPHSASGSRVAVRNLVLAPRVQPRLRIGEPGDRWEREADRVADQVMRMPAPAVEPASPEVQRVCPECEEEVQRQPEEEEEEMLQAKPAPELQRQPDEEEEELLQPKRMPELQRRAEEEEEMLQPKAAPGRETGFGALGRDIQRQAVPEDEEERGSAGDRVSLEAADGSTPANAVQGAMEDRVRGLGSVSSGLPDSSRGFFEPRFGRDFSSVRLHTDADASGLARQLGARAFTRGSNIVFAAGEYQPATTRGRRLIAHELAHVVQQGSAVRRSASGDGERAAAGGPAGAPAVQCDLAIRPPNPGAVAPQLTAAQLRAAIRYNRFRFKDPYSIAVFRDVIGISRFPAVSDADFAQAIAQWQAEFNLRPTGKATVATTRTLVRELRGEALPDDANQLRRDNYVTWSNVGAITRTTPTAATHGRFAWNVDFQTSLRNGWLIQEVVNTRTDTACGGVVHPNPGSGTYWEAWWVDGTGDVRLPTSLTTPPTHSALAGHDDGWVRVPLRGTRGSWGMSARLYTTLRLPAGFQIHDPAVPWAGDLPATAAPPDSDDLGLAEARRSATGTWNGCPGPPNPPNNFHRGRP